jgi:S-adenosylmethionine/arginine decarboxylase-like enzyme
MSQATKSYKRIIRDGEPHYGQHLMLTATGCNERLLDCDSINAFIKALVKEIDMVAYGEPLIARFGQGIEIGISAVQLIETSAITLHTNDGCRDLYLDVFSCKEYDPDVVLDVVDAFFDPHLSRFEQVFRK